VTVDAAGFHPANITIPAGKPSLLRFTRTVEKTCSTAVIFHGLDLRRDLPVGKTVEVTLTPEAPGTLTFACPMEMSKGTVTVTPAVEK
jgi:plastocyanin domain-containing protein